MKYLLLQTKCSTGQILHTDGKLLFDGRYEGNTALPYIITFDLTNAEEEAQSIVEKDSSIEVTIFTENEEYVKTIHGNYIPPPIIKDKWWKFW